MLTYSHQSPKRSRNSAANALQKKEHSSTPGVQTKLTIGKINDPYEQEADHVADQVVNAPTTPAVQSKSGQDGNKESNSAKIPLLQKAEEEELQTKPALMKMEEELQTREEEIQAMQEEEVQAKEDEELQAKRHGSSQSVASSSTSNMINQRKGSGSPLPSSARSFMESRMGADFGKVRVHNDDHAHQLNTKLNAQAFAVGNNIFFNKGKYNPDTQSGKHLLAHELTHTIQQQSSEIKPMVQRQPVTQGDVDVERAKARLALLEKFQEQWNVRKARILRMKEENKRLMDLRYQLDEKGGSLILPEQALPMEIQRMSTVNKTPLNMEVTEQAIRIKIKFQVRFEDTNLDKSVIKDRYQKLKANFSKGMDLVWNQSSLSGTYFRGRKFEIVPSFQLVSASHKRDPRFWLVTIRPTDLSSTYNGQSLGIDEDIPTAAADSELDNGVMSLPPSHVTMPGIIGHELLHLFGFIDRYADMRKKDPKTGKTKEIVLDPTRETNGREDPLGGADATILKEDLNMLFEYMGIHRIEASRGLTILNRLETKEKMTWGRAQSEIMSLQQTIKQGQDSKSLIDYPDNFNDRMFDSANDI